jgi:YD repeat-containing protein
MAFRPIASARVAHGLLAVSSTLARILVRQSGASARAFPVRSKVCGQSAVSVSTDDPCVPAHESRGVASLTDELMRPRRLLLSLLLCLLPAGTALAITSSQCEQNNGSHYCEPKPRLWGGYQSGGYWYEPAAHPSFGELAGALLPRAIEYTGPNAYPVYAPRTDCGSYPNACYNANSYTGQTDANSSKVYAERWQTSPPATYKAVRQGTQSVGQPKCRDGLTATTSGVNFCSRTARDADKDVGCPDCNDPVIIRFPTNAGTGNKYQQEVDYVGGGVAPLEFRRDYNSQGRGNPSLGLRWRHSYDRQIVAMESVNGGAPAVMVKRHTGPGIVFTYWGGAWKSSKDITDRLTKLLDGSGNHVGWEYYVSAAEETETYDAAGKLTAIASRGGLIRTLTYSDTSTPTSIAPRPGFLIQVTDPFGRHLDLTWSVRERIDTLTDPDGQVYRYAYNTDGHLSQVKYPDDTPGDPDDNPTRTYHYENTSCKSSLTGITDETNTRFSTYTYDSQCRVSSTAHAGGANQVSYSYGTGTTTVTDARSSATTLTFQVIHGVTRTTAVSQPCAVCGGDPAASISHDANGNVSSRVDFNGNRTDSTFASRATSEPSAWKA